jgi:hypothetical protein
MPNTTPEMVSVAVKAVINLEKTRSGKDLLRKLSLLSTDDVEGVNRLLENWTVRDALAVLDEIDRRLSVVEALSKVMDDPDADELHTIHPLVTHSRWLFGPEYDFPLYSSNVTIRKAAEKVFKKQIDEKALGNPRQRPDLIFLKDSTLSLVGTEEFGPDSTIVKLTHLLLLELKKGRSAIGREEIRQAEDYVEDLLNCGLLDGPPFIHAFVVGFETDAGVHSVSVGKEPVVARVEPCTFGQLVRTAKVRLFKLHERISERYQDIPQLELAPNDFSRHVCKQWLATDPPVPGHAVSARR